MRKHFNGSLHKVTNRRQLEGRVMTDITIIKTPLGRRLEKREEKDVDKLKCVEFSFTFPSFRAFILAERTLLVLACACDQLLHDTLKNLLVLPQVTLQF